MNFIDIHCHPSMKIYLFDRVLTNEFYPHGLSFSANMFMNLPAMQAGGVNAGISVYHLPEHRLMDSVEKKSFFLQRMVDIGFDFCADHLDRLEDNTDPNAPFFQIKDVIQQFEDAVQSASNEGHKVAIARNLNQFNALIAAGNIVFIHSIEGAHCLGHDIDYATCEARVQELYNRGLCQFTLAHFFENILVSSQGGIPPKIRAGIGYQSGNTYPNGYNIKGDLTNKIIHRMLDIGIIIDLCHCHPGAKQMIYNVNDARGDKKRPLVFSHTGIREVVKVYNDHFDLDDLEFLPDNHDIDKIKECGGVLGILFMDYWLNGEENTSASLPVVVATIQHIAARCGNYDHISIGSDFDGFTEVPADIAGPAKIPELINKLRDAGISEENIRKICYDNYMRVLANGWGPQH